MLKLRDIMTRQVVTVEPDTSVRDAMELFASRHIGGAPVVEGERVVGVVTMTDLLDLAATLPLTPVPKAPSPPETETPEEGEWGTEGEEAAPPGFFTEEWTELPPEVGEASAMTGPEWTPLEEHTVREAMTERVVALSPEADVQQVADLMRRAGVHRILAMEGDRLEGIASALDVSDAVARHGIAARRYVFKTHPRRDDRDTEDTTFS